MLSKSKSKYIQSLYQKKIQEQEQCFVVEGIKIINELLATKPAQVIELYVSDDWLENPDNKIARNHPYISVTAAELKKISAQTTPSGILAVVSCWAWPQLQQKPDGWQLLLDTIQDPGNLGTLIRIADWFGIKRVVCSRDCVHVFNPKVLQSTMGSFIRIPVYYTGLEEYLDNYQPENVYAAVLGGTPISEVGTASSGLLLIGNESKGLSANLQKRAGNLVTIPSRGQAESLNAAVAAGILLSHLTRGS
jgi:RNA methyltransferase, TrmH family